MSRYIDADALHDALKAKQLWVVRCGDKHNEGYTYDQVHFAIDDAPSIDAVELGVDYRLDFYDVNYKSWRDEDGVEHMRTFCIERKEK